MPLLIPLRKLFPGKHLPLWYRFASTEIQNHHLVWTHFGETSTETMEDKIKRMLREEVRQMMADE